MTESLDNRRLDLVRAAQQQWIAALTDLGGRNTLLYYKDRRAAGSEAADAFQASVRSRLADYGITVVPRYGVGGYRVDFAAAHPDDPSRMILAVEADGASYRDSGSVRDRDRLRKEHLERLGWRFHRLWSTNWFHDPDAEVARLREACDKAVAASPPPEPALPEETADLPDP